MALCEDFIAADPVLQRVFFDGRRFAPFPGHEPIVNIALHRISELKVLLLKCRDLDQADCLVHGFRNRRGRFVPGIRSLYLKVRRNCDGYYLDDCLPNDGCEHVVMFEHDSGEAVFQPKRRAWAELRHRYKPRSTVSARRRSSRTATA